MVHKHLDLSYQFIIKEDKGKETVQVLDAATVHHALELSAPRLID